MAGGALSAEGHHSGAPVGDQSRLALRSALARPHPSFLSFQFALAGARCVNLRSVHPRSP